MSIARQVFDKTSHNESDWPMWYMGWTARQQREDNIREKVNQDPRPDYTEPQGSTMRPHAKYVTE